MVDGLVLVSVVPCKAEMTWITVSEVLNSGTL